MRQLRLQKVPRVYGNKPDHEPYMWWSNRTRLVYEFMGLVLHGAEK